MPVLKLSVTSEDIDAAQSSGGEPAPPGFYTAEIASIEEETPENKNPRLHVIYKIVDEAETYAGVHEYLTYGESSKWKLTQFGMAVGLIKKAGNFNLDTAKVKGKRVKLHVINETYAPANGPERMTAKPAGVWAVGSGPSSKAANNGTDRLTELQNMTEDELVELEDEIRVLAEPAGVDVDEYSTWAEAVEAIAGGSDVEPEPEPEPEAGDDERWHEILAMGEDELAEIADELDEYADGLELDSEDYPSWEEYREAIVDGLAGGDGTEAETEAEPTQEDYNAWSIPELRGELKARSLEVGGAKAVLVKRLLEADANTEPF